MPLVQASFSLRLPKPWHATWLFRGCVGGLFLAVLFIADRRRLRRIEQTHEVVLSERARIARDIHDTLEQDLLGLRLQVDAAALTMSTNPERSQEHLASACDLITDGVVDLRNSIWGLKSSNVSTSEIVQAVRARLSRLTAGTSLIVDVQHIGQSRVLSATFATHAVHVAREAVTNAIKHAHATSIAVTFDTTDVREVVVHIKDNGLGMVAERRVATANPLAGGQGLTTMQSRAIAMGGSLTIESPLPSGTQVTLRVPSSSGKRKRG